MKKSIVVIATMIGLTAAATAQAAEIRVLSAGAVEPGLHAFAALVKRELGHDLKITFNTAPQIAKRLAANEVQDILVSPPAVVEQAAKEGKVVGETRVPVGRVGAGIIVRDGATAPNVGSVDALKQALLSADTLVYNSASTGIYLDKLFAGWGILEQIKGKTTRYADGASVMEHVIKGSGNQIGFGAITEIKMYTSKGLKLVGPLPAEVQNYTNYEAVVMNGATAGDASRAVLKLLATPAGKATFVSAGVE
jgi:molybdate transport system substrate-binding protein